jgi:hypothetical protein
MLRILRYPTKGDEWEGHVLRMEKKKIHTRFCVGGHRGKRPLGRPRLITGDNIKIGLKEMEGPDAYMWYL